MAKILECQPCYWVGIRNCKEHKKTQGVPEMTDKAESNDFVSMKRALDSQCKDKLTEDDISIICSGEPPLWRTSITIYNNNSQEQAIKVKKQIVDLQQKATQGQRLIELINNWFETYPTRFKEWCEQSKILDEKYPWNEIDEQHENHEEYHKELAKLAERLNFGDFEHIIKRLLNQSKSEKQ